MNAKQRNDRAWNQVAQDRRQLEALKEAAKAFLAGNSTAEAVAAFTAALDDSNFQK